MLQLIHSDNHNKWLERKLSLSPQHTVQNCTDFSSLLILLLLPPPFSCLRIKPRKFPLRGRQTLTDCLSVWLQLDTYLVVVVVVAVGQVMFMAIFVVVVGLAN